ncbi:D-glycero-beta-D-manno-heptose 1-phosphate adenylyltransferase [Segetibacter sp.]|jgi:rfaE bifunctional protein nucleotidyltransferase chain/domain|uniref:D-glycero-beta-D-manno-heptose 1-phosphate adenylyltransferase n=1 Tax=Segetibacter sp. TaxID=2231182 RepID=UPI002631E6A1|nr:D-glycero-beta-D-manno-heptose 1-phosphate adenylyltransferase [Segetibacter sp.]MCW3081620.1 RfaE bifunctional protein [Segetibacter sp.]
MKKPEVIPSKIYTREGLVKQVAIWRFLGKSISFTNGCFDILHSGHISSLSEAAREGDILIVGVNTDASTKRLKGEERPVNNEGSRALLLASLAIVDAVTLFDEDTPFELILALMPDVIVKGGDYTLDQMVGAKEVIANGGRVVINPIVAGYSTTGIIEKIRKLG